MWYNQKFFKYSTAILLILLIILLFQNIAFLFKPILDYATALFFPIMLAGILYYILRPFVYALEHQRVPRVLAIALVYLSVVVIFLAFTSFVGPIIVDQINVLTADPGEKFKAVKETTGNILSVLNIPYTEWKSLLEEYLYKINAFIRDNIVDAVTTITKFAVVLIMTPFVLFYFLKDDHRMNSFLVRMFPVKYQTAGKKVIDDVDKTLATFITGQVLVALSMGFLLFIGYLIIGLNNAAILVLFASIFFMIPIVGSIIAIIPSLLFAFSEGTAMTLKVIAVLALVLTLEGNLISPQIMSQRLHIHPLVLLLILLASGSLYGILGLFLATPIYALVRVISHDLYQIYHEEIEEK